MTVAAQRAKLALIAALPCAAEIAGWRAALEMGLRAPFAGEVAALALRERELKEGKG